MESVEEPTGVADPTHEQVEEDQAEIRRLVRELSIDDVTSGSWFTALLANALDGYAKTADWEYFQRKYAGVPADAIVEQRIGMAARYAAVEGGLSAGAYTATIAATIGSAGTASPVTVPAALTSVLVDVAYISRLQLRLAHDISVLYRVPLDLTDPDDLWKLLRIAFTIKSGEAAREGVLKVVPVVVRPLVKRFYARGVLAAGRNLPVVGRLLLQRNVIKVGIPLVGIPLAVVVNRYTTRVAGRHARAVFRNEARILEVARRACDATRHPLVLLWVAWLTITSDARISDDEALLMRHLVRLVDDHHQVSDDRLAHVIEVDADDVLRRIDSEPGDLSDVYDAAVAVAEVDGAINRSERRLLLELERRCRGDRRPGRV